MKEDSSIAVGGRSPGALLREAREARGISLDEASRVTRIGKNYLAALESDRHDKLPSAAYVRGFLRNYASFLGLSPDALTSVPEEASIVPAPPEAVRRPEKEDRPQPERAAAGRRRNVTIPLLAISAFLVVLGGYFFEVRTNPRHPVAPPAVSPPVSKPAVPVPETPPVPSAAPTALPDQISGSSDHVLRMKVNEETHLVMTIDDAVVQEYQLRPGDVIEWKGDRLFAVELSNAGGVEAELGGKRLRPFGPKGISARVVVRTDGRIE